MHELRMLVFKSMLHAFLEHRNFGVATRDPLPPNVRTIRGSAEK